jgi:hypothetical protein
MTTHTTTTALRHDSDANFRLWGAEMKAALAAVGLVQTADTGQINWVTVARPATNTDAGYEIWRFNDTAQSTLPIFMKIHYGTFSTANGPRIRVSFGSGSDGSGSLTGAYFSGTIYTLGASLAQTSATTFTSYWSCSDGFFGFFWKVGSTGALCLFISRTCDENGNATDDAFVAHGSTHLTTTVSFRGVRDKSGYLERVSTSYLDVPICELGLSNLSGDVSGDTPVLFAACTYPRVIPLVGVVGILQGSGVAAGTTFTLNVVGASKTYIAGVVRYGPLGSRNSVENRAIAPCMVWS